MIIHLATVVVPVLIQIVAKFGETAKCLRYSRYKLIDIWGYLIFEGSQFYAFVTESKLGALGLKV